MSGEYPIGSPLTRFGRIGVGHQRVVTDDGVDRWGGDRRSGGRRLRLQHHARATELREIRSRIDRGAAQQRLCEDTVDDLHLAVGEAVSNGVEHAYLEPGPDDVVPTVEVELELRSGGPLPV